MGRTFSKNGFSVTVNDDRSIRVRPGDWISKYSDAIYGDPLVNWDRFKRKDPQGVIYIDLDDPNKIKAGELLYHPDPLPGERNYIPRQPGGRPNYPKPIPRAPGTPPPNNQLDPHRVVDLLRLLKQWLCPVNDWKFESSEGLDLSAAIFSAHYCRISARRQGDPEPTRFHAVGAGLGVGLEAASVGMSPPGFWEIGFLGKFPTAGRSLSANEICGNYVVIDFSGGAFLGGSFALLLFGLRIGGEAFMRTLINYLQGTSDSIWVLPRCFNGAVVMLGLNAATPNLGVSIKLGLMHRRECIGL